MLKTILQWLDDRTGWRGLLQTLLYQNIPGGPKWRHVWGGVVIFALAAEFVTGLGLWMAYSPGANSAWESVFFIQNELPGGWLLRGLHHFWRMRW